MRIVIFPDLVAGGGFCGFIDGKRFLKEGNDRESRTHKQQNRIWSGNGIAPTITASETQGRYHVCYVEDNDSVQIGETPAGQGD